MDSKNAYFQIEIRPDGTYIILRPAVGEGLAINNNEVINYLNKKGITYNETELFRALSNKLEPQIVKLTDKTIPAIDESMEVVVNDEKTMALARFYPPTNGGNLLTYELVLAQLAKNSVKFGIDDNVIFDFVNNKKYCTDYCLARGTLPIPGKEAIITYNFNCDISRKPKTNEDGSVDFHKIDVVSHVEEGDLLATLEPAVEGIPGRNVSGTETVPPKVVNRQLKYGKNITLSEDGLRLYSQVSGHVSLVNDTVFVTDVYKVPANVDTSTGDITYNGSVEVVGNVTTGFKIEAKGDIIVNGVVEGATLISGGQIILHRGIQGMGRGVLVAGTNIITKFIENATAKAGGYITTEAILHSKVIARGDIIASGRKGFITGGEIKSATLIAAKNIGSSMETKTELEVGVDPQITEEINELSEKIKNLEKENEQIGALIKRFSQIMAQGIKLDQLKATQFKQLAAKKQENDQQIDQMNDRVDSLYELTSDATGGSIKVEGTIHPGCKMTIGGVTTFIRSQSKYCRFIREGADVKMTGY